jgi:hypothetical protein
MVEINWHSRRRAQDVRVSKYFLLSDFLYSDDACRFGIKNYPMFELPYTPEIEGIKGLCNHILDPVVEEFGHTSITFAYCGTDLWRFWKGEKAKLEGNLHTFRPAPGGIGGAADICVHGQRDPRVVANWIKYHCPYDRIILYPNSEILCVAWTEREPRYEYKEWVLDDRERLYVNAREDGPRIPQRRPKKVEQGRLFFKPVLLTLCALHRFHLLPRTLQNLVRNNQKNRLR